MWEKFKSSGMCQCVAGLEVPESLKDCIRFRYTANFAQKMKALRPFDTTSTTHPNIQRHIKQDLNLHSEISFTLLWRHLEGDKSYCNITWKLLFKEHNVLKTNFKIHIEINLLIFVFFFSRCHASLKKEIPDFGGKTCWKTSTWIPRRTGQCDIQRGLSH
jgi:hypothetical protein